MFQTVQSCVSVRYIIDSQSKTILDKITIPYDCPVYFPAIDSHRLGAGYNDFWALGIGAYGKTGRKFFDRLVRGCWDSRDICDLYVTPRGEYLGGEPVCIVNPDGSGESVVVVQHLIPAEN